MALWGAEVKPGQEYVHKLSQAYGRLRITRATLGSQMNLGSSTLQGRVGHERRATLCSLHPMSKPTCSLEIELEEENDVTFSVDGQTSIFLSGYYINAKAPTCTIARPALLKRTHQEMPDSGNNKKSRREDGETCHGTDDQLDDEETDGTQKSNATPPPPPVHTKKKVVKKPNDTPTINKNHQKSDSGIHEISDDDENETTLKDKEEAALKVEKIIEGRSDAKVATDGNKVSVNFVGCLKENGRVFDKGGSYQFLLGAGKVIRGWDMGIKGMKVGEERRLTIPPNLGYGGINQEKIPANSWLIYTITLLEVEQTKRTKNGSTE